ncbi:hypothetical protein Tco_1278043 [Tanacetum coccineum]
MAPSRRSGPSNEENPDIAAIIAQQLQTILPQIITQVTNNVNNANANGGNGWNNGCSYKTFMACNPKEYDGKGGVIALTRWIEKIESVFDNSRCAENQRVKFAAWYGYQEKDKIKTNPDKTKHENGISARKRVQRCPRILLGQPVTHLNGRDQPTMILA